MEKLTMEKLVSLSKQYGYIFQGSEIYDGLANTWDYGPLGVELKNNVKKCWWKRFVQESSHSHGVDAAILMNPRVWEASGHVGGFSDPLLDCRECNTRHRADKLIENFTDEINPDTLNDEELYNYIMNNKIVCPKCGKLNYTEIRQFNLMFETNRGVVKDKTGLVYLRPETAQGEFVNFLNVQRTMRTKLPFGIGQIGKAFRNEITPGNFTFRTIEFEQMEHQLFCKEGTDSEMYKFYKEKARKFLLDININEENIRFKDHEKLAHYAKEACDIEFKFPFGWGELMGTHNRTDFDLKRHQEFSKKSMEYLDQETGEKFIPYVIESSIGCDRLTLAILSNAYRAEVLEGGDIREVMAFHPAIAPYKVAVLPLVKKYHSEKAEEIFNKMSKCFNTSYDESGNIGKRYRRQDIMGTPICVTVDDNETVTLRDRDTMDQITLSVDDAIEYIEEKIRF